MAITDTPNTARKWPAIVVWAILATVLAVFLIRGIRHADETRLDDFRHFYWAAEALARGGDPYTAGEEARHGYIYPPLVAFLYIPYAQWPMNEAKKISVTLNVLALAAGLALAARAAFDWLQVRVTAERLGVVLLSGFLLTLDKLRGEVQMLQTNTWVFLGWAVAFSQARKRPALAGFALGFACAIKLLVIAMLPYFLLRRQWRAAAGMVGGLAFFMLLPALWTGWHLNLHYLRCSLSGWLTLFGVAPVGGASSVEPLVSIFSISIPSAFARAFARMGTTLSPFLAVAAVAVVWLAIVRWLYRRTELSLCGSDLPPRITAAEWVVIVGLGLAFSPQTNTRHTVMVAGINLLGAALLFYGRLGRRAIPLGIGLLVMLACLTLPPGHRVNDVQSGAVRFWHDIGGPSWGILAACTFLLWAILPPAGSPAPAADAKTGPTQGAAIS